MQRKKRKNIILAIILTITLLSGCGNKSNSELVDIEQFKCQDSIETVFNVLGKTDAETANGVDCYKYTELNLWGYNGDAVFSIRNDGKTIQNFYCYLTLSDKEFAEILSIFSDKYGSYTASNYGDTMKTYEWAIGKDNAVALGYSNVHIQYNGNKKYIINFSDDMSYVSDEEYYEYLEEKNQESSENALEVIAEKEYDLENGDSMSITVFDNDGKAKLYFSATIGNEDKAALAFSYFYTFSATESLSEFDPSISVICNGQSAFYIHGQAMGFERNGEAVSTFPNWVSDSLNNMDKSDEELNNFIKILQSNVEDFQGVLE